MNLISCNLSSNALDIDPKSKKYFILTKENWKCLTASTFKYKDTKRKTGHRQKKKQMKDGSGEYQFHERRCLRKEVLGEMKSEVRQEDQDNR